MLRSKKAPSACFFSHSYVHPYSLLYHCIIWIPRRDKLNFSKRTIYYDCLNLLLRLAIKSLVISHCPYIYIFIYIYIQSRMHCQPEIKYHKIIISEIEFLKTRRSTGVRCKQSKTVVFRITSRSSWEWSRGLWWGQSCSTYIECFIMWEWRWVFTCARSRRYLEGALMAQVRVWAHFVLINSTRGLNRNWGSFFGLSHQQ